QSLLVVDHELFRNRNGLTRQHVAFLYFFLGQHVIRLHRDSAFLHLRHACSALTGEAREWWTQSTSPRSFHDSLSWLVWELTLLAAQHDSHCLATFHTRRPGKALRNQSWCLFLVGWGNEPLDENVFAVYTCPQRRILGDRHEGV